MIKVSDIVMFLKDCKCVGDQTKNIVDISSLTKATKGNLVFCAKGKEHRLSDINDCVVIIAKGNIPFFNNDNVYIMVDDPRATFAILMRKFFTNENRMLSTHSIGIHPTAIINCNRAFIAKDVEIGPYTYIEGDCSIGENTRIGSHVHIEGKVVIGKNVCILSLATIGASAGSYVRDKIGNLVYMPQLGGVFIGDNVGIASRVNIHRAALDDTIIGQGSRIGVGCNIGHNIVIGKQTFIAGLCNLGGGTKIGNYSSLGLSVVTGSNNIKIGNNVIIGDGSVVTKSIKSGCIAYGVPAKAIRENSNNFGE